MKYAYLFIPGLVLILAPVLSGILRNIAAEKSARRKAAAKRAEQAASAAAIAEAEAARRTEQAARAAEQARKKATRKAEQDARTAAKLEAARQLAEYRERALSAARELAALEAGKQPTPAQAPEQRPETISAGKPAAKPARPSAPDNGPKPFAGQVVSFTGTLRSMKRAQAIEKVNAAGGRAYDSMPAGTTILVIGDTKGRNTEKMDRAAEWIGQVKRITEQQFLAMFATTEPTKGA